MTGNGLPDLIAKAFEAACDTDGMTEFLEGTAGFFGAQQGAIVICPLQAPTNILTITFGIAPERIREKFAARAQPESAFGRILALRPGDALAQNGGGKPPQRVRHLLGGLVTIDEHNLCIMALWRQRDQPPFSEPERETLCALIGYFRRAINVNKRFVHIHTQHKNAVAVLDQAPRAVIILDQDGCPTYRNFEATRVLSKDDGLSLTEAGLTIADTVARDKIQGFLQQIRGVEPGQFHADRLSTVIPRQSGGTPYKLIMYGLPFEPAQALLNPSHGLAVLMIFDSETLLDLNKNLLHDFYNLTPAETALAQSLFMGKSLPEASDHLGISINTTRTQLRNIFKKVGVHSQAALLQEFAKSVIQG